MPDKRRIDVFISSTSKDLEEYRKAAQAAILSLGLFPDGMETWPTTGKESVNLCREKINNAEIYLGIYAHRYGWQPDGYDGKSITELEFDWASEVVKDGQKIPRLCFVVKDDHPWPKTLMELEKTKELDAFKKRVGAIHRGEFTTPDNLEKQIIVALQQVMKERYNVTVTPRKCITAPKPEYFAGRTEILRDLIDRLSTETSVAVTAVRAIGGMGKTTLAKELAHRVEGKFGIVLWAEIGEQWSEEKEKKILRGWATDLAGIEFPPEWDAVQLGDAVRSVIDKASHDGCSDPI